MTPHIETFFDPATYSLTHLVSDPQSRRAVLIDPVLDFDPAAMRIDHTSANKILEVIQEKQLRLEWILETHAHADHLTAAYWFKQQTGASIAIGNQIGRVQQTFNQLYELSGADAGKIEHFDRLLGDEEQLALGDLSVRVMSTPGHTPSCCTYVIGDSAFVGDTLFMPDYGTARCDFPGGDAAQLYRSLQRILSLPGETKLYMCHDYQPGGRELEWQTTVAEQKQNNIHVHDGIDEAAYVKMRSERDQQLAVPKLILPSLQINIRAGRLPEPSQQGGQFLKLPINKL